MSHAEERNEKNCLNCGASVMGRYCHVCGQENIVPHETFSHMVKHFFYDITHFDTKFFDSVKYLIRRPGFLSKEYMRGKRAGYLNPIKMYVFTSAVFFLIFFSLFSVTESSFSLADDKKNISRNMEAVKDSAYKKAKTKEDSLAVAKVYGLFEKKSTAKITTGEKGGISFGFDKQVTMYKTVAVYDSVQHSLPDSVKDGWMMRLLIRKAVSLGERYEGEENKLGSVMLNKFMHMFPYILFISLPLYALFLKILYVRNKKFYFADHGIFLIHLYVFTFILMLVFIGLAEASDTLGWDWVGWIQAALVLYGVWYAYKAMRNFYEQGRLKTLSKFILFNLLCLFSIVGLFTIFLLVTFFQV